MADAAVHARPAPRARGRARARIEVIGYQVWRRYPALSNDDVLEFHRLCGRHGLEPAALGGYVDLARRVDRLVTADEAVELLEAQVETARLLGFPVLRLHAGIPVTVLERVAPLAERHDVVLATEVQGGGRPITRPSPRSSSPATASIRPRSR